MFRVGIRELPAPASDSVEVLSDYIVQSLDLVPSKGKKIVATKLLEFFVKISGKRGKARIDGVEIDVKNGAAKVQDIKAWLEAQGVDISLSQLYTTYLRAFLESGIVVKRKYSTYGLRAPSLEATLREVEREIEKHMARIKEVSSKLDELAKIRS